MNRPGPIRKLPIAIVTLFILAGVAQPAPAFSATPVGPATYQETSSAIQYTGSWQSLRSGGSSGGAIRYSKGSASASLTFQGDSITWYTWKSKSGGKVDVYLDGVRRVRVDSYSPTQTTKVRGFTDLDLADGAHTIKIVSAGTANASSSGQMMHLDSFVVGKQIVAAASSTSPIRARSCPPATMRVDSASELSKALAAARPGTSIHLDPGTYQGSFALDSSGTAGSPIWVCGPRTAVIQTGTTSSGTALRLTGASHVRVTGFTVRNALQGVMVKFGEDVAVTDLSVHDTGNEGIHLYAFTTDSFVVGNLIERTGVVNPRYGEGVYIGTSGRRWVDVTNGNADRSDRNTVAHNTIKSAGAEAIEAKEGTSDGSIRSNTVIGHGKGSHANGWIMVTGNDWNISDNSGVDAYKHGYASFISSDGSWGHGNTFRANTGSGTAGTGVWIQDPGSGSQVSCDNWVDDSAADVTNVFCVP